MIRRRKDIEKWKKKSNQIIIPIGSLEQHGPHLPVSTDTIIIEHLAKTIAEKIQSLYILQSYRRYLCVTCKVWNEKYNLVKWPPWQYGIYVLYFSKRFS